MTATKADALAEHGIEDIEALATTTVDDLAEYLDVSFDEAEAHLTRRRPSSPRATRASTKKARTARKRAEESAAPKRVRQKNERRGEDEAAEADGGERHVGRGDCAGRDGCARRRDETVEQHAVSAEFDPTLTRGEVEPSDAMIAEGYDEAVEQGTPFSAERNILAKESADPVAVTEAEPMSEDELFLQGAGRDLRPDTITPAPDITSTGAAMIEAAEKVGEGEPPVEDDAPISPRGDFASEASAPEVQSYFGARPPYEGEAAPVEDDPTTRSEDASDRRMRPSNRGVRARVKGAHAPCPP